MRGLGPSPIAVEDLMENRLKWPWKDRRISDSKNLHIDIARIILFLTTLSFPFAEPFLISQKVF